MRKYDIVLKFLKLDNLPFPENETTHGTYFKRTRLPLTLIALNNFFKAFTVSAR